MKRILWAALLLLLSSAFGWAADDVVSAVHGTVTKMDAGTKTAVVKTKDGTEYTIKFVDETTPGDKQFFWRNFIREQDVRGNSTASVLLLNNLSGQLGLQFHSERRSVEVWFVESNAGKIPPVSLK